MKIFGSIYPFIEAESTHLVFGRHVANFEFLKALLTFGSFDEYHLFCLDLNHIKKNQELLQGKEFTSGKNKTIRFFLIHQIIDKISTTEYHLFHLGGWGYFFSGLVYLRNRYAKNLFPITGMVHSLNGLETPYHALKICSAPLYSFDTIVSSSNAGIRVLEKQFRLTGESFSHDGSPCVFRGSLTTIPLGINQTFFTPPPREKCRRMLGLPLDSTILLSVGRFSPQTKSDLYPLMVAFKQLLEKHHAENLTLVVAGGAQEHEKKLARAVADETGIGQSVRILANFPPEHKNLLYGAADIYVSLSDNLQETFGISVIEAMAAGLPAIVSDFDGYKEIVVHNSTGIKVPTVWIDKLDCNDFSDIMNFPTMQLILAQCCAVDIQAFIGACGQCITDKPLRTALGTAARQRADKIYRWEAIIGQYETLWDTLHERSRTARKEERMPVGSDPFTLDYLTLFDHYPSKVLADEDRCSITPHGRTAIDTMSVPASYADISVFLDSTLILSILTHVSQSDLSINEIIELVRDRISGSQLNYMVLWMAKYDLVRIMPPPEKPLLSV